jgi:hypothetical protein
MIDNDTARRIVHGSPDGYRLGCRSQGGCANHGHPTLLTCADAYAAQGSNWKLRNLPTDQALTRDDIKLEKPAKPAKAAAAPKPVKPAKARKPKPTKEHAPTPAPDPRPSADSAGAHVTRSRTATSRVRPVKKVVGAAKPAKPKPEPKPRTPRAPRVKAAPQPPVHGSVHGHRRGCKTDEACPNYGTGKPTCTRAHLDYYRDYRERRRRGDGPDIAHGTPSGYQMGCHDRTACPGSPDGTTCPDASLNAERDRRRRKGIPTAAELTDSTPAREHIAALREAGMSVLAIAAATRTGKTSIKTLIYGRDDYVDGRKGPRHGQIPARITVEKAAKILAVKIPAGAAQ